MKRKSRKQFLKKKKEFRYHNVVTIDKRGKKLKIRHPTYVFLEKGNIFIYVSITHSKGIEGELFIKLRKNPNPKDRRDSYRIATIREDRKDTFGRRQNKWIMDSEDDKEIRELYKKR